MCGPLSGFVFFSFWTNIYVSVWVWSTVGSQDGTVDWAEYAIVQDSLLYSKLCVGVE